MRGAGSVYRPGDRSIWWIKYYRNGKPLKESSQTSDLRIARKLLKQRIQEIAAEAMGLRPFISPRADRLRVKDLIEKAIQEYCTKRAIPVSKAPAAMRTRKRKLINFFGEMKALRLDGNAISKYIESRLAAGKKPATVNRETELLRRGLRLALEDRELSWIPKAPRLREDNVRTGFFEDADFEAVVVLLPEEVRDFPRFSYWTGVRKKEASSYTWAMVDRDRRELRVPPSITKTKRGRVIPLVGPLKAIIERRWSARLLKTADGTRISEWVFHREGYPLVHKSFDRAWNKARKLAGQPDRIFHDLRRTAIRNLCRAGVPEKVAMEISGHKTRAVFDRYNIVDPRDMADAITKTAAFLRSASETRKIHSINEEKLTRD